MTADDNTSGCRILDGLRVVDFSRYLAGPFCGAILGDFGAEVIRVEPIGGGQDRGLAPVAPGGDGALFLQLNRNKKSVALDLTRPDGRAAAEALIRSADIVVTNMPPAALVQARLDYDSLSGLRADIIAINISGYGREGPLRDRPSFDAVGQAMSGAAWMAGVPGRPSRAGSSYVDYGTGMGAALGGLAAVIHRMKTGEGQYVDASLFATAHAFINGPHIEAAVTGRDHPPVDNRSANSAPSDFIPTSDGVVALQVVGNSMFRRWANMIDRPDLASDPRLQSDKTRALQSEELSLAMADWARDLTTAEVIARLSAAGIPCGPVLSPRQAAANPDTWETGVFQRARHREIDRDLPIARLPIDLGCLPRARAMTFAAAGEHTREVLTGVGYGPDRLADLLAGGAAAQWPGPTAGPEGREFNDEGPQANLRGNTKLG